MRSSALLEKQRACRQFCEKDFRLAFQQDLEDPDAFDFKIEHFGAVFSECVD